MSHAATYEIIIYEKGLVRFVAFHSYIHDKSFAEREEPHSVTFLNTRMIE